jgi:hypothetical protein
MLPIKNPTTIYLVKMKIKPILGLIMVFAFLCPIVGDGVLNADLKNGDNGVKAILPPAGTSLLPGKNKAGDNANENAYNKNGGPDIPTNNPHQGTPGFTPIWP